MQLIKVLLHTYWAYFGIQIPVYALVNEWPEMFAKAILMLLVAWMIQKFFVRKENTTI